MSDPIPGLGYDIPGRYDAPGIHIESGINYEAAVVLGGIDAYFSALDLLEVTLAVAWEVDPEGVREVLSRGRTNGFSNPQIGDTDAD
jgi:hypothetical protein